MENQAVQADRYAKKIHRFYPNASYMLVNNQFVKSGVTFENPNVYDNLPKDLQEAAVNGDFRKRLAEYVSLNDGLSLLNRDSLEVGTVNVMYDESLVDGVDVTSKSS